MKKMLIGMVLLSGITQIYSQEKNPLIAYHNPPSHTVVNIPMTVLTPDDQEGEHELQLERVCVHVLAPEFQVTVSPVQVMLTKHAIESQVRWVEKLYQDYFTNHTIIKTQAERIRHKREVIQNLFDTIRSKIEHEKQSAECRRLMVAPCNCADDRLGMSSQKEAQCCLRIGLYLALSPLMAGGLYGLLNTPFEYEPIGNVTANPCAAYSLMGTYFKVKGDCMKTSNYDDQPFNVTQLKQEYGQGYYQYLDQACRSITGDVCLKQVHEYNHHVYPRKLQAAWLPMEIIAPLTVAGIVLWQIAAYKYRAWKRRIADIDNATESGFTRVESLLKEIGEAETNRLERIGKEQLQQVDA